MNQLLPPASKNSSAATAWTGTNPVPGTPLVFAYDGLSRRSKKEVYTTQAGVWLLTLREHYVYDGWNLLLTARENNKAPVTVKRHATHVWGPDLASLPYGRSNWQEAGGVDGLLMVIDGENSALAYGNVDYNGATAGLGAPPPILTTTAIFPSPTISAISRLLKRLFIMPPWFPPPSSTATPSAASSAPPAAPPTSSLSTSAPNSPTPNPASATTATVRQLSVASRFAALTRGDQQVASSATLLRLPSHPSSGQRFWLEDLTPLRGALL